MAWAIDYSDQARAQLGRLDRHSARQILDALDGLAAAPDDPRTVGTELAGRFGTFRQIRVGDCRVICDIGDDRVHVLVIGTANHWDIGPA